MKNPEYLNNNAQGIHETEIYEYSQTLNAANGLSNEFPYFQVYKLMYAEYLMSIGQHEKASKYCLGIKSIVKSYKKESVYINEKFQKQLMHLKNSLHSLVPRNQESWYNKASTFDGFMGVIDRGLSNLVISAVGIESDDIRDKDSPLEFLTSSIQNPTMQNVEQIKQSENSHQYNQFNNNSEYTDFQPIQEIQSTYIQNKPIENTNLTTSYPNTIKEIKNQNDYENSNYQSDYNHNSLNQTNFDQHNTYQQTYNYHQDLNQNNQNLSNIQNIQTYHNYNESVNNQQEVSNLSINHNYIVQNSKLENTIKNDNSPPISNYYGDRTNVKPDEIVSQVDQKYQQQNVSDTTQVQTYEPSKDTQSNYIAPTPSYQHHNIVNSQSIELVSNYPIIFGVANSDITQPKKYQNSFETSIETATNNKSSNISTHGYTNDLYNQQNIVLENDQIQSNMQNMYSNYEPINEKSRQEGFNISTNFNYIENNSQQLENNSSPPFSDYYGDQTNFKTNEVDQYQQQTGYNNTTFKSYNTYDTPTNPAPQSQGGYNNDQIKNSKSNTSINNNDDDDLGFGNSTLKKKENNNEGILNFILEIKTKTEIPKTSTIYKSIITGLNPLSWMGGKTKEVKKDGPIKANLGGENSLVYDKISQRWVLKDGIAPISDNVIASAPPSKNI